MDGHLYFTANDGTAGDRAVGERRDRGAHGPRQEHQPERREQRWYQPLYLTAVGSTLFFSAVDQEGNTEADLWIREAARSRALEGDGTERPTRS